MKRLTACLTKKNCMTGGIVASYSLLLGYMLGLEVPMDTLLVAGLFFTVLTVGIVQTVWRSSTGRTSF